MGVITEFPHVNGLGKLTAPRDVSATYNMMEFNISWILPFFLQGINVSYTIQIRDCLARNLLKLIFQPAVYQQHTSTVRTVVA